jgi:hypothetical protein
MQTLPIQAIANQQFSTVLDNNRWNISIRSTNGTVSVSMTRNDVLIIENLRAVSGMRIIPAQYQEAGNFALITQSGEIPDYTKFGVTQTLIYLSAAELVVIREPQSPPVTTAFFNPIGALPLRFSPQNYS